MAACAKKIGLDLDGVIAATAQEFLRLLEEIHGRHVPFEAIRGYRLEDWTGLSTDQVNHIFRSTPIFERTAPVPGAAEGVRALRAAGWEVHIVTYRAWKAALHDVTRDWLARHDIPYDAIELTRTADKSIYARAHGLSAFVEDNWHSVAALAATCDRVLLVDCPYNQGPLPPNAVRVRDWPEVVARLAAC